MASVHLAVQESLGRQVALKVLRKFDRAEDSERFLNEGRLVAALNHQNIITIHDIGVAGDRPFIAMEYLEGGSLKQRIERGMTPDAAVDMVIAIGGCLDFVHRKGMIHRDVKPANILFHANGTPKLTDFGIAKSMDVDSDLTLDGSTLGSPYYLSPEQAQNKPLDGRADVYSLGIIFYEMLTGEKPFRANSHIETIVAQLTDELPVLPPALAVYQEAVDLMTAKERDERFSSAGEMLGYFRALRDFAGSGLGGPTGGSRRAPGPGSLAGGGWRSARGLTFGAGAAAGIALVAWLVTGWVSHGNEEPRPTVAAATPSAPAVPAGVPDAPGGESAGNPGEQAAASHERWALMAPPLPEPDLPEPGMNDPSTIQSLSAEKPDSPANSGTDAGQESVMGDGSGNPQPLPYIISGEPTEVETHRPGAAESQNQGEGFDVPELLELGAQALAKDHLTIPPEESALFYFRQVLERDPGQPEAEQGLDRIAARYADLSRTEIERRAFSKAERYLDRGLQVRPDYGPLLESRRKLEERKLEVAEVRAARSKTIFNWPALDARKPDPSDADRASIFHH